MLVYAPAPWAVFLAAALLGAGLGAETELLGYMASRYFGMRRFGSIYGIVFVGFLLGTSGGPYMYDVCHVRQITGLLHSYDPSLKSMIVLMLVTTLIVSPFGASPARHSRENGNPEPKPTIYTIICLCPEANIGFLHSLSCSPARENMIAIAVH